MANNNQLFLSEPVDVSIVLPCLNEEPSIGSCLDDIHSVLRDKQFSYEVVVCDNGSTDRSAEIAAGKEARLVNEQRRGYGSAYQTGILSSRGRFLVLADADGTYDFSKIPEFISFLEQGCDMVIGNRFGGQMENGAMPWLHRYIGNPILSFLARRWFGVKIRDVHCGMRALSRDAYNRLNLKTKGMEFASEMIIRAGKEGLKVREVPINYRQRAGVSKLRTFRDGWRHLRFMLLFAPAVLFFAPGLFLVLSGLAVLLPMTFGPLHLGSLVLDLHPMFGASLAVVLGVEVLSLGIFTKLFTVWSGFEPADKIVRWWRRAATLERLLILGTGAALAGFVISGWIVLEWARAGFGALFAVRPLVLSFTLLVVGFQICFTAFFSSLLTLHND